MIESFISEVSISQKHFVPQNLRIYDPIVIQVSQLDHMMDWSTQECHKQKPKVQMDEKGRRKFLHNSHIHWDISVRKIFNILTVFSEGYEHFTKNMSQNLLSPRDYLKLSYQTLYTISTHTFAIIT